MLTEFHLRQLLQNQGTLNANGIVVGADGPKRCAWLSGDTVQVIILAAARLGCSRYFSLKILLSDWKNASFAILGHFFDSFAALVPVKRGGGGNRTRE